MPMLQTELATQINNIQLDLNETICANAWANGWIEYFSYSSVGIIPCIKTALEGIPKTLMLSALSGLSTAGASALQAAIIAFWGGISANSTLVFPTVTSIVPPPGLFGINAALLPIFVANTTGKLSKIDSANAISFVLHSLNLGGTAVIASVPPPVPII